MHYTPILHSAELRERYLYMADGVYRVRRTLRERMVFAPQDVLTDPPFTDLDLVTCRNLLIYIGSEAARRVLFLLHSSLRMGGHLFLGKGEALPARERGFEPISARSHIYKKNGPFTDIEVDFPKHRTWIGRSTAAAAVTHRSLEGMPHEWSEAVRISNEELEASREELQALNQELRASNEQLNVANDELNQVNAKLQEKIAELEMQSSVLRSGGVITLALDEELRVLWFTPAISELFPLIPQDVGRRITDFAHAFEDPGFIDGMRTVMRSGAPQEAEILNRAGSWFLRRIRPYRSATSAAPGVAVTFADITARKLAEDALRRETELRAVLETDAVGVVFFDGEGTLSDANEAFLTMTGWLRDDVRSRALHWRRLTAPEWLELSEAQMQRMAHTGRLGPYETEYFCKDGTRRWMLLTGRALGDGTAVEYVIDITDRKRVEAALRENERILRENEAWLAAQKEAFQAAMDDAPLEASLGILTRTAVDSSGGDRRCAFYIADTDGSQLHHVVGMSESYARSVDGSRYPPNRSRAA